MIKIFLACSVFILLLVSKTGIADVDFAAKKAAVERFITVTQAEKHTEAKAKAYLSQIRLSYIEIWGRGGERLDRIMALDKFEVLANEAVDSPLWTRDYMTPVLTKYFTASEIQALSESISTKSDPGQKYRGLAKTISRETLDILQMRVDETAAAAANEAGLDPPIKIYQPA